MNQVGGIGRGKSQFKGDGVSCHNIHGVVSEQGHYKAAAAPAPAPPPPAPPAPPPPAPAPPAHANKAPDSIHLREGGATYITSLADNFPNNYNANLPTNEWDNLMFLELWNGTGVMEPSSFTFEMNVTNPGGEDVIYKIDITDTIEPNTYKVQYRVSRVLVKGEIVSFKFKVTDTNFPGTTAPLASIIIN
jgi:hypothetical protein